MKPNTFFWFPWRENLIEDIHSKLQEIKNPIDAIGVLIREMDYETDAETERGLNIGERTVALLSLPPNILIQWKLLMSVDTYIFAFSHLSTVQPLNVRMHLSQLYGSSTTVNMVCRCVYKMSMTRFLLCRDLLILQQLLLRLGDTVSILEQSWLYDLKQYNSYIINWTACFFLPEKMGVE